MVIYVFEEADSNSPVDWDHDPPDPVETKHCFHESPFPGPKSPIILGRSRVARADRETKDFSVYLKKRATVEEEHANGLRKLSRAGSDAAVRPENRQGTYSRSYKELNRVCDRTVDHGLQFAVSVQKMADDLHELATNIERGRKHWKQTGLSAEKKVIDAETAAEKAKAKYDSLAEQYDRVKTGDKQGGKFGFKGPKSPAQVEEELLRKVQHADGDYLSKVQTAQTARRDLVATHRPQAVHNLQQLISECDSGLALQLQKFGTSMLGTNQLMLTRTFLTCLDSYLQRKVTSGPGLVY